jgi:hypothetical protein
MPEDPPLTPPATPAIGGLAASQQDEVIEGGDITGADEILESKPTHRERMAGTFALTLLGILAGALLIHYIALLIVIDWGDKDAEDMVEKVFNAWLPVLSGLVGSAATYYLTKQKP